jgi:hypothetical protein
MAKLSHPIALTPALAAHNPLTLLPATRPERPIAPPNRRTRTVTYAPPAKPTTAPTGPWTSGARLAPKRAA